MQKVVEVYWIARYDYKPAWKTLPHSHDFHQFVYILEGSGSVEIQANNFSVCENSCVLFKPSQIHRIIADKNRPFRTLDLKFRIFDKKLSAAIYNLSSLANDVSHDIRQILENLKTEGIKKEAWYQDFCDSLLVQCLILFIRKESDKPEKHKIMCLPTKNNDIYEKTANYIKEHCSEEITVLSIAFAVGYSVEYLSKKFKQATNESLRTYLMRTRIEKAIELMKYKNVPIKEIAFNVGFKSIHHFSRVFKEITGIPPATWREKELSGVWKNIIISPGFINSDVTITETGEEAPKKT